MSQACGSSPRETLEINCSIAPQEEYMLTEEGFKIRVAALRKEEEALSRERERLERDKARYCIFRSD